MPFLFLNGVGDQARFLRDKKGANLGFVYRIADAMIPAKTFVPVELLTGEVGLRA